jgi:hypothetical protein
LASRGQPPRLRGRFERDEKVRRPSLSSTLPAVLLERLAQQLTVAGEKLCIAVPQPTEQERGALDVAEQRVMVPLGGSAMAPSIALADVPTTVRPSQQADLVGRPQSQDARVAGELARPPDGGA